MARYVTMHLRLDEATYRKLRNQARRRGVPVALLAREAVDRYLGRAQASPHVPFGDDPADVPIGSVESAGRDESFNHDHYLYGWSKEGEGVAPGRRDRSMSARRRGDE